MSILVIGDSLSFGSELSDVPEHLGLYGNDNAADGRTTQPSQYAWPSLLAKRLGTTVDNLSIAGGSNDRIFRLALSKSVKNKYSLVICAWTTVDRFDFSYQGKDLPLTAGADASLHFPWFKQYFVNHYDSTKSQQRWLAQLLSLQAFFAQQQQPYLFAKGCKVVVHESLNYLSRKIDTKYCVNWESDMMSWCVALPQGENGHFLEQGHQLVADRFIDKIQALRDDGYPVYNS
jgi:lysophospholipase L1-like esterase